MKPDLATVEDLYHSALAMDPNLRAAFLARVCGHDEELWREVQSLLAQADAKDSFLEMPAAYVAAKAMAVGAGSLDGRTVGAIPAAVGHYRVLSLLGEGGMGAVYEAEQDQPRRIVALKVIKPGFATAENLRRLQHESQALGRLQHAGIAQIYEASTADSGFGPQPYFAMELIRGRDLRSYSEAHRLSVRERLELMAKVCDAVQHAHQRGVIHRDLKPSNILIDETGQPKILDFGVARVTESDVQHTRQTDLGQIVGTLAYMSPEQALGDSLALDVRSDVYALGVILYEVLASRLPYNLHGKALHEALEVIREEEPTPLSSIQRSYRGDIATIVSKALEKDRVRRYASAADLAEDIRQYLEDEPISARPASAGYQVQKFARRHKALVASTAAVFVVLTLGVIASTWQAVRARTAERKAADESAAARAINDFLQNDLLAQASVGRQTGSNKTDPNLKVRTALDRAAARLAGKFDRQPEVEVGIRYTIGQTYMDLGLYPEARIQLERALAVASRALGAENPRTLKTINRLGRTAYDQGKYPEAESLYSRALAIQRRVLGEKDQDTLLSMNGLAATYTSEGKYAQAEALLRAALDIWRRVASPENGGTLACMVSLASVYGFEGKYKEEAALDTQTVQICLRAFGPENPDTLTSMNNLAGNLASLGQYTKAAALFRQLVQTQRRMLGPEHHDTLMSTHNLAFVYGELGEYAQGEALLRQILVIQRRVLGPEHSETLMSMSDLAASYVKQGRYAQAETLCRQALDIQRRVLGPEHADTLGSMNNLADAFDGQGHHEEADALLGRTLEISRRALGPEYPSTLLLLADSASTYQRQGKYNMAETYAAQALAARRHALGSDHPDTMASAVDLALAYLSQWKFVESEPLAREAIAFDRKVQPDDWQRFRAESVLGASLAGQKRYAEAEPLLLEGYQGLMARKARIGTLDLYHVNQAHEWLVKLSQARGRG